MITLVLGGTRSGKSEIAERIALRLSGSVTYLATAVVGEDPELAARVLRHRERRPAAWTTIECGALAVEAIASVERGTIVLDALGSWVATHEDFAVDTPALVEAMKEHDGDVVVVSDEVGLGVHPSTDAGRHFRDVVGSVNRLVADAADDVLLVIAGRVLPLDPFPAEDT